MMVFAGAESASSGTSLPRQISSSSSSDAHEYSLPFRFGKATGCGRGVTLVAATSDGVVVVVVGREPVPVPGSVVTGRVGSGLVFEASGFVTGGLGVVTGTSGVFAVGSTATALVGSTTG